MLMRRLMSTALAVLLFAAGAAAQPRLPGPDALRSGVTRLERAEYTEALTDFEQALDAYAATQKLEEAKQAYMAMFVGRRQHANVLMKAMKVWVEKHRADSAGLPPAMFNGFDDWVQERDALAAATINLVHNLPDWK